MGAPIAAATAQRGRGVRGRRLCRWKGGLARNGHPQAGLAVRPGRDAHDGLVGFDGPHAAVARGRRATGSRRRDGTWRAGGGAALFEGSGLRGQALLAANSGLVGRSTGLAAPALEREDLVREADTAFPHRPQRLLLADLQGRETRPNGIDVGVQTQQAVGKGGCLRARIGETDDICLGSLTSGDGLGRPQLDRLVTTLGFQTKRQETLGHNDGAGLLGHEGASTGLAGLSPGTTRRGTPFGTEPGRSRRPTAREAAQEDRSGGLYAGFCPAPTGLDGHLSGPGIAPGLERPTRSHGGRGRALGSYLASLRCGVAVPPASPQTRWALAPPFHPCPQAGPADVRAVCSLWPCPTGCPVPGVTWTSVPVESRRSSPLTRARPSGLLTRRQFGI